MTVFADRIKETTTTTGTGSLTLLGAALGFGSFSSRYATGDNIYYTLVSGFTWEVGIGTFTSPSTLARTTILASSSSDTILTLAAGTKEVFVTIPANAITPKQISLTLGRSANTPDYVRAYSISDATVTPNSRINMWASANNDSYEMDAFNCSAYCAVAGTITAYITAIPGPVAGQYNFQYTVT